MIKHVAAFAIATVVGIGPLTKAQSADLDELSKYLGFIEGFQYLFEFCQAETKLPRKEVDYAREHISERRALILSGLTERQRDRVYQDAQATKKIMLDGVMTTIRKDDPNVQLRDLCRNGFFTGVMQSEAAAERNEEAAIRKAKE
jgi:hypothetical protein